MRSAFVHEARLDPTLGVDDGAPGAAVTVALCGHWEHGGECRWPHHTAVERGDGPGMTIRTVFASDPADEATIRAAIADALRGGRLDGPHGQSTWTLVAEGSAEARPEELAMATGWTGRA